MARGYTCLNRRASVSSCPTEECMLPVLCCVMLGTHFVSRPRSRLAGAAPFKFGYLLLWCTTWPSLQTADYSVNGTDLLSVAYQFTVPGQRTFVGALRDDSNIPYVFSQGSHGPPPTPLVGPRVQPWPSDWSLLRGVAPPLFLCAQVWRMAMGGWDARYQPAVWGRRVQPVGARCGMLSITKTDCRQWCTPDLAARLRQF
jgi:hypothetical protein